MSERHSGQVGTRVGNEMDSPTGNIKYSNFRDFCSTFSIEDSGYNEMLKSCCFDTDKEFFVKKHEDPTLNYEFFETTLDVTHPLETPTKKKRIVFFRQKTAKPPDYCDTPKLSGKRYLRRRRRLDVSFSPLKGNFESQDSSIESCLSEVLNFEKDIPSSASGFPKQNNFSALVTDTLKTEEATSSPQKLRLNFSQQKTSTVDDSEDDCSLFEVECISPIQGNNFKDSITHDFSDSSPCVNDENTFPELLSSSGSGTTCERDEDIFMTPINNPVANIKFKASHRLFPQVRSNISTPEDSGFYSLFFDKSDSLSDQESSFQQLLQKHKGTLTVEDTIRRSRRLGRLRRLSTLQEQGSQSETEEESQIIHSASETTPAASSDISESQPSSDSQSEELILGFNNVSNTPALQLVHELFMKNKKKRFQKSGTHEFLEDRDEAKIAVLQCVLAGLIGKKMGIEKLDILTELKYRNLKHILAVVLDSLSAESLCSVWNVSRNWREIIVQNKKANQRRRFYLTQLKTDAKQAVLNVQDAATRFQLSNRSALRSVQAQARTPSSEKEQVSTFSPWGEVLTPIASSSINDSHSKQEEYVRVAKTLFIDEALKPCPRCQSPAKYQPYKKRGLCSRTACGFDFCVLCLCAYHGSEECSRRAAKPRNRKDPLPGSAQSKRNLKRL